MLIEPLSILILWKFWFWCDCIIIRVVWWTKMKNLIRTVHNYGNEFHNRAAVNREKKTNRLTNIYDCQRRQRSANMAVVRFIKRRVGVVGVILIATTIWIFYLIVSAPAATGTFYYAMLRAAPVAFYTLRFIFFRHCQIWHTFSRSWNMHSMIAILKK